MNAKKRVHDHDDKQTIKRLKAERDRLKATAGEQSYIFENQKENIEQFQKIIEKKNKEVEKLKADIKRVFERQSADAVHHQKSIQNYEMAFKIITDYAESNKTQYDF